MKLNSAKDLEVYKKAYTLAMGVFELSKGVSSRRKIRSHGPDSPVFSLGLSLREAWAKRRYEAHFVSKPTDCDGENSETDSSLDFARDCRYVTEAQHRVLIGLCSEVGRMLGSMIANPNSFLIR